jgi:hypothetical protein
MVRIVQCLCPQRHCIMAYAYEPGETILGGLVVDQANAVGVMRNFVDISIRHGLMNPWCGLCHSREWIYEDAASIFRTMEEARPALKIEEEAQRLTREWFARQSRN